MKKVLFVCLGNICRSPLAAALFNKHVEDRGLQKKYMADSCGIAAYNIGEPPDNRSRAIALDNGMDYSHMARQINDNDFAEFDMFVAMDISNKAHLQALSNNPATIITLMRDFDFGNEGTDVPDPYFGSIGEFQDVFDILERSTITLLENLVST